MGSVSRNTAIKVIYWNGVAAVLLVGLVAASIIRRIHAYDTLIVRISREQNLDPRLVSALIWRESRFRPAIVGTKGEIGLMQVTEAAGKDWAASEHIPRFTKSDLFNPETNIRAGTWYLARAIEQWSIFSDPLPYALAHYNAGRSNVEQWVKKCGPDSRSFWKSIPYPTTKDYVRDILVRYRGRV